MKHLTIIDYLTAAWLVALFTAVAVVCAALPHSLASGRRDYDLNYSLCVLFRNSPAACVSESTALPVLDTDW